MRYFVKGFTLVEITLSVAMISMIVFMTLPMLLTFIVRNDLDIAKQTLVQDLWRAQALSQSADGDTTWGVHVSVGSILVYKGASYGARDVSFDEETTIPSSVVPSGVTDVVFSKLTGLPQTTGSFVLTSNANETRTITINQKGMVDY